MFSIPTISCLKIKITLGLYYMIETHSMYKPTSHFSCLELYLLFVSKFFADVQTLIHCIHYISFQK